MLAPSAPAADLASIVAKLSAVELQAVIDLVDQISALPTFQSNQNNFIEVPTATTTASPTAVTMPPTATSHAARRRKARRQNRVVNCGGGGNATVTTATSGGVNGVGGGEFDENNVTTMMIRNVPRTYTQRILMEKINQSGFQGSFDFFYLPTDISTGRNLGYAFINFCSSQVAMNFRRGWSRRRLSIYNGNGSNGMSEQLSISAAVLQGLERNVDNLTRNASVHRIKNAEYLPMVMCRKSGELTPYKHNNNYRNITSNW